MGLSDVSGANSSPRRVLREGVDVVFEVIPVPLGVPEPAAPRVVTLQGGISLWRVFLGLVIGWLLLTAECSWLQDRSRVLADASFVEPPTFFAVVLGIAVRVVLALVALRLVLGAMQLLGCLFERLGVRDALTLIAVLAFVCWWMWPLISHSKS